MADDEHCASSPDGMHCVHWWDGERCCQCGAAEMPDSDCIKQGMKEGPLPREAKN